MRLDAIISIYYYYFNLFIFIVEDTISLIPCS